jgi:Xaa-Pro dipeptidase
MNPNDTFSGHRKALMSKLKDGLILLAGGREITRNYDVNYVFRQGSDFLWLTGVEEPGCALLLDPKRKAATLFMPRIDDHHRVWEGHVPSPAEARKLYGVPKVAYLDELPGAFKAARRGSRRVFTDPATLKAFPKTLKGVKTDSENLGDALEDLRTLKDSGELAFMRRANEVSGAAHAAVMRGAKAGMREYQVQALFDAACLSAGLKHLAYPSIVAAGANGAVLHYRKNNAVLKEGQLLLIDAGAEVRGYAADITRTFPVAKRFTRRQADVYDVVLATQKALIAAAKPGLNSAEWQVLSMRLIAEGLRDLGLLKGSTDALVETGAVRLFYPHGIGHLLGLDVHDGLGGKRRKLPNPTKVPVRFVARLEAGMAITAEPGIYFIPALLTSKAQKDKHKAHVDFAKAQAWLDFGGVRIEDDIVVRASGAPLNLTDVPKERAAVEALRAAVRG